VETWREQIGGFSPGCATRVVAADGTRAFVKAVGAELNLDTPTLFRREIEVLELIGADPLWAALHASYDDGQWVALLLEDLPGGHPDLADDDQMQQLIAAVDALGEQLAGVLVPPGARAQEFAHPGLVDVQASFRRWLGAFDHLGEIPDDLLPVRIREDAAGCRALVAGLLGAGMSGSPTGTSATTTCSAAPTHASSSSTGARRESGPRGSTRCWPASSA
jgi:hypothetical protein